MADLPRGTVAFLFTDIEGSTRRWEQDRSAMASVVERHFAVLHAAVAAHGGVLFKQVGDAAQAAFPTASAAVSAALDGHRALAAEVRGSDEPIRVRIALHVGDAVPDARGDYLAPCLNRLARLLGAGHGGQILLSDATAGLVDHTLPAGASLRDLGTHRLRDLSEPEPIWQLAAPDLRAEFPPLATLERHPTNLPVQPTPLVGRNEDARRLHDLVVRGAARLVTLTGPGGTGKTRLALQAAADAMEAFPDGVFFVDLAPIADAALVLPTVAATLGVRDVGASSVRDAVTAHLRGKRLLLVLDNLEQVVTGAAALSDLLAACPELRMLATSREPLRVRAEQEFPVAPLPVSELVSPPPLADLARIHAVDLFARRARAARPDFALTAENAAAVAGICFRLEGLPLAIELAAARIKILPPAMLLDRLTKRLPVLTGGARDLPARQRTLRDAIAWSFNLLEPEDQTLFRRLAVFVAGCTFEAAEDVANPAGSLDLFGGLASLVDKSLLRRHGTDVEPRFGMLETVREFALEQLAVSGEEAATRRRHAAHQLAFAERASDRLWRSLDPHLLDRIAADLDNTRAVLAWLDATGDAATGLRLAAAHGWYWFVRGFGSEGRAWLERARDASVGDPTTRGWALMWASDIALLGNDWAAAEAMAGESVALFRATGVDAGLAAALTCLGAATNRRGDPTRARALLEECLGIARSIGHTMLVGVALGNLAEFALQRDDLDGAEALIAEAHRLQAAHDSTWGTPMLLALRAELAHDRGDLAAAVGWYTETMAMAQAHGNNAFVGAALIGLGAIAVEQGKVEQAAVVLGAAEAMSEVFGLSLFAGLRRKQRRAAHESRTILGESAFADAWAAGRVLRPERAVEIATALARGFVDGVREPVR